MAANCHMRSENGTSPLGCEITHVAYLLLIENSKGHVGKSTAGRQISIIKANST